MNQKTKVYIFIGVSVLILFLLFRYEFKHKGENAEEEEQVYVDMPDADIREVSESKTHAYATYAQEQKEQDIEDYWDLCNEKEEQRKEEKTVKEIISPSYHGGSSASAMPAPSYENPYRETAEEREQRHQRRREEAIELAERMMEEDDTAAKRTEIKDTISAPEPVVTRTSIISQSDDGWGSGISSLESDQNETIEEDKPLRCMFSRQERLKNGQRVAVILLEEIRINGTIIPKNTHIMGTCRLSSRLEVIFESIEIGGRILTLGYEAYDMDGSKGIYCPDVANVGKTAMERGTDIARSSLSSRFGRVAQDVVSSGVSIVRSSSGEATVTVPSGYGFFIVKKKNI